MKFSAQVGRSAVWAIIGQGSTAVLSMVNFAVVGRFVDPKEYGSFLLAMTVLAAIQWLSQNAYREPVVQAPNLTDGQINSVFSFTVLVGIVLGAVMCAVALYFELEYGSRTIALCVVVLAVKLLLDSTLSVPFALRARELSFKFIARTAICANLLATAINVGLLLMGWGVVALVLSQAAAAAVTLLAFLYFGGRRYPMTMHIADLSVLRGYSSHVILWQALEAVGQTVDRYFIAARLSLTDLGLYGFGKRLNDVIIDVLVGATSSVALPAFSQLQHDRERLRNGFLKAVRMMLLVVLPVLAALAVTAEDFIPLMFGEKWNGAMGVYRCFLLMGVIQGVGILQGGLLRSMWKPGVWTRYQLAQCGANVIVLSIVAGYGIEVLALSIVIRAYTLWSWVVWQTCKALDMKFLSYAWELVKPLAVAAAAAACGFWLRQYFDHWHLLVRFVVNGLIVLLLYGLFAMMFLRPAVMEIVALGRNIVSKKMG